VAGREAEAAHVVWPTRPVMPSSVRHSGDEENRAQHARSMAVLERLWSMGHPAPHYEQVVDLGDVLVIIQTEAQGVPPIRITRSLVDRSSSYSATVLPNGEGSDAGPLSLHLLEESPSHDSLRKYSDRTRQLLDWIEVLVRSTATPFVARRRAFRLPTGNVLVHPNRLTSDSDSRLGRRSGQCRWLRPRDIGVEFIRPAGEREVGSTNTCGGSCVSCRTILVHRGLI